MRQYSLARRDEAARRNEAGFVSHNPAKETHMKKFLMATAAVAALADDDPGLGPRLVRPSPPPRPLGRFRPVGRLRLRRLRLWLQPLLLGALSVSAQGLLLLRALGKAVASWPDNGAGLQAFGHRAPAACAAQRSGRLPRLRTRAIGGPESRTNENRRWRVRDEDRRV
jgi:hypothetical protein